MWNKKSVEPAPTTNVSDNQTSVTQPPITAPAPVSQLPVATQTNQDCGSVVFAHYSFSSPASSKFTAQERTSLDCFHQAILKCQPSTFSFTSKYDELMTIHGKSGNNCTVSWQGGISNRKVNRCNFPIATINELQTGAEKYEKQFKRSIDGFAFQFFMLVSASDGLCGSNQ